MSTSFRFLFILPVNMNQTKDSLFRSLSLWSLLLLLATSSGHIHSPDGEVNYRTALSLSRGEGYAIDPLPDGFLTREGQDGKQYPQYGPLQPLLSVPLIKIGDLAARWIPPNWLGFQEERLTSTVPMYRPGSYGPDFPGLYPEDHQDRVRRICFSMFNSIVTWLTVVTLAVWAIRIGIFGKSWWLLPIVYLVGTYAWPHSRPSYTETLATFFLLVSCYLAWMSKEQTQGIGIYVIAAAVGLTTACAVLTRLDSAVALPGILLIATGSFLANGRPALSKAAAMSIGAVAFLLVCSWIPIQNQLRFGSLLASGYEDQKEGIQFNIPILHALWIYLLSPGKGIFWYSPPLIAALVVWPNFFKRDRFLCLGFAWIVLAYVLIIGKWQNLGGWCWGPRHLFQVTPFLLFPLPLLLGSNLSEGLRTTGKILLGVTIVLGMLIQVSGVLVDYMWPLEKALRTMPPTEQTPFILSGEGYGPLLHLKTWRFDRDPDWLLVDLWRSGELGARIVSGIVWFSLLAMTAILIRSLVGRISDSVIRHPGPPEAEQ
ncbi:MAG: hypothetical protein KC978_09635 [Candidatus Omnitrophica bacterium]|nr:hypothetical protein [Candidatus Omnitrophota bacterium]